MPLLEGVYQSSRDHLTAMVPTDKIEGFRSFVLAALAHYTVPSMRLGVAKINEISERPSIT